MPPAARHRLGGPVDVTDMDVSFPLERLFDPYNLDHLPEKERLKQFKKRDLAHVKHYKAAVKIFGGPLSRKRVIEAPPMETPMKHRLGLYHGRKTPPLAPVLNAELKPQVQKSPVLSKEEIQAIEAEDKESQYKKWMNKRQTFRHDLENMGLSERWLNQKPNMTVLEKRVLRKMIDDRTPKIDPPPPPIEIPVVAVVHDVPNVKIPAPLGIRILEQHLRKNKKRLVDLFVESDKNKDWKISRDEFRNIIRQAKVPMSEALLEDLILSLDTDFDNLLDYKELARGLECWKRERRENRRKELSRESSASSVKSRSSTTLSMTESRYEKSVSEEDDKGGDKSVRSDVSKSKDSDKKSDKGSRASDDKQSGGAISHRSRATSTKSRKDQTPKDSARSVRSQEISKGEEKAEVTDADVPKVIIEEEGMYDRDGSGTKSGGSRSSTPQYLNPPDPDTREERMMLTSDEAMVDLRKRDREALKANLSSKANRMTPKLSDDAPGIIKVGDKAIDDHCMRSTMDPEIALMVDKFRQLKLREFCEINKLCQLQGVSLSPALLERVLLYPPDKPHSAISHAVKTPGAPLLSSHYADPPKRPKTPIEVKHKDRVRRSKSGKLLIDSRHQYPQGRSVAATATKANLSTGRAFIRRKVDCWMTFEEYDKLTSHLAIRYQQLHGSSDNNAFWPGHLLDKIKLCMPPYDKPLDVDKMDMSGVVFHNTRDRIPSNLGKTRENSAWPINESGYIQSGMYDRFERSFIHND
ncbi:hypothetical protein FSP39_009912 [Pinctada imbricata]|uniref:EF-hand domain-containing protein n=1 Tax=Pinctada imbricata TaxID=66713 RepID=A0AA88YC35_PINIB|nr:hypothetical protein FSP39_009912 [Pinctada imbricata]